MNEQETLDVFENMMVALGAPINELFRQDWPTFNHVIINDIKTAIEKNKLFNNIVISVYLEYGDGVFERDIISIIENYKGCEVNYQAKIQQDIRDLGFIQAKYKQEYCCYRDDHPNVDGAKYLQIVDWKKENYRPKIRQHNKELRSKFINEEGNICVDCGTNERLEIDHIICRSNTPPENIFIFTAESYNEAHKYVRVRCGSCNTTLRDKCKDGHVCV